MLLEPSLGGGGGLAAHILGMLGHAPRHRYLFLMLNYTRAELGDGAVAGFELAEGLARCEFGVSDPRLEMADGLARGFERALGAFAGGPILGDMWVDELRTARRGGRKRTRAMGLRTVPMLGDVDDRNLPVILEAVPPGARRREPGRFGRVIEAVAAMVASVIARLVTTMISCVITTMIAGKISTSFAGCLALRAGAQHFQRFAQPILGFL